MCDHDWHRTATPPDGAFQWFRCQVCKVFGFRRNKAVTPYVCQINGCSEPAIDRLFGRGPRACILWRCHDHIAP